MASVMAALMSETTAGTPIPGMARSTNTSGIAASWTVCRDSRAVAEGATIIPSTR